MITLLTLKLGLLVFWAVWSTIVFLTNTFAGLKALGRLPEGWKFASPNYKAVVEAVASYTEARWPAGLLFAGVILWQGLIVLLFWLNIPAYWAGARPDRLYPAFAASLGLWAAFMIADELFIEYKQQTTHLLVFAGQLLTLLFIEVV